jgi:signal transduction histidine kinase
MTIFIFTFFNTYGVNKINHKLIEGKKNILYEEATLIRSQYMTDFYKNQVTLDSLGKQLKTIDTFLDTRIWIVSKDGRLIFDTHKSIDFSETTDINKLAPGFLNGNTFSRGVTFQNLLEDSMLSVVLPVTTNFTLKGYIVMHTSLNTIAQNSTYYMDIINISILIFLLLAFIILAYLYFLTVAPLKKIIIATKQYTVGHFDYPLKIKSHDEFRDLSNAVSYMAGELNNLDDYQKNFVANISHDFRSPLTSIKGYAEAILDGTIPVEMQDKYLGIILFETERLTKLTTNLLALNSFEHNGSLLDITNFDINHIIKQTAESFEGSCIKKKIKLKLLFSDTSTTVTADMDKIQQVLYNLLDNAIKFSPSNSTIIISTKEKNDKIFIAIKDNGIGIPKESINKIWERFYKTDKSRGKDKKGTGLGLAISKEIITAHGENINVISTEEAGTEFIFTLAKKWEED